VAAHRARLKTLVIPAKNEKDMAELPKEVRRDLNIKLVDRLDQVFEIAFDGWVVSKPEEQPGEQRPEVPLVPPVPH